MNKRIVALARWLGGTALALVGIVLLVFIAVRVVPGDPVDQLLGEQATDADRAELRARMHLDGPLHEQLGGLVGDFANGSMGISYALRGRPTAVRELLVENAPHTLALAVASLLVAALIALPMGLLAAVFRDGLLDHGARAVALVAISIPAFVSGPLALYVLAVLIPAVPTPAHDAAALQSLVLPACVIGFALSGRLARLLRATALEQMNADYVIAARARGVPGRRIVLRHVLPNAMLPVITVLGLQLAALLGGALVTEKIFGRPGLGTLLLDGIAARDHAVVQGCVVVIGVSYAAINGGVDLIYRAIDPRIGAGERR